MLLGWVHRYVCHCQKFSCNYFPLCHINGTGVLDYIAGIYFYLRFVASMDYYGLSLGVSILPGSIYINMFLSGLIELPCYIMACILLNKVGRRWPNAGTLVASGVCCVLIGIFIYHTGKSNTIISYFSLFGRLTTEIIGIPDRVQCKVQLQAYSPYPAQPSYQWGKCLLYDNNITGRLISWEIHYRITEATKSQST